MVEGGIASAPAAHGDGERVRTGLRLESLVKDGAVEVSLREAAVAEPGDGEVVVRVEAAPINPSDLGVMFAGADLGQAEVAGTPEAPVIRAPLPAGAVAVARGRAGRSLPLGNEGAGTVVAAGAGAEQLVGRIVALTGGGTYSQYRRVNAALCMPLPEGISATQGAASFINPMTALGMVETTLAEGHKGLVHTAAASRLGQMLNRLCLREQIPLVNVVRSPRQELLLREAGAEYVCDSSADDFKEQLTEALRATGATIAFDAVGGGTMADLILARMEAVAGEIGDYDTYGSAVHKQVYIYGSLDRSSTELRRRYGMSWGVGGWLLTRFLEGAGPERVARLRRQAIEGLTTTFATEFTDRVSLAGALRSEAVAAYGRPATETKFLITPNE